MDLSFKHNIFIIYKISIKSEKVVWKSLAIYLIYIAWWRSIAIRHRSIKRLRRSWVKRRIIAITSWEKRAIDAICLLNKKTLRCLCCSFLYSLCESSASIGDRVSVRQSCYLQCTCYTIREAVDICVAWAEVLGIRTLQKLVEWFIFSWNLIFKYYKIFIVIEKYRWWWALLYYICF
jgi:hypothetical protein